jgi:hypothetical protein
MESISSMKMIAGEFFSASSKAFLLWGSLIRRFHCQMPPNKVIIMSGDRRDRKRATLEEETSRFPELKTRSTMIK